MKAFVAASLTSLLLVACDGSAARAPSTSAAPPPTSPTPSGALSPIELPTSTGAGFCSDRGYALDAAGLVRDGQAQWRQVARFIAAARTIIRDDADSAPSSRAAVKVRQLALTLRTLELSVRGSVENYPDDYSSQTWADAIPGIVAEVSRANDCPP